MIETGVPRVDCPEHGVRQAHVPWVEPGGRFPSLLETLTISWLKVATIKSVPEHRRSFLPGSDCLEAHTVTTFPRKSVTANRTTEVITHIERARGFDETTCVRTGKEWKNEQWE